jgi:predicted glutamine amidotransferase
MCRLYGFRATEPTKVECTLVHAQNALMVQSRRDRHGHGWGIATYEDHRPRVERHAVQDCEICGFPHIHHTAGHDYRALVVASEPISREEWREVPEHSIHSVTPDMCLRSEPADPQ